MNTLQELLDKKQAQVDKSFGKKLLPITNEDRRRLQQAAAEYNANATTSFAPLTEIKRTEQSQRYITFINASNQIAEQNGEEPVYDDPWSATTFRSSW